MSAADEPVTIDLDRRSFMKASALAGGIFLGGGVTGHVLGTQEEQEDDGVPEGEETAKVICNYCAVGCGFKAVKDGNSFVAQEPWFENPINNGSLCSKGAGILETEHSPKRLKHPMRKEDGEWRRVTWDEAYQEIVDTWEETVEEYSRESVMLLGSAHHSNEAAYASRKLAAFMGTNNVDHQARICHSPTVTGLANTWGFGAMTNTINDYRNFDLLIILGQNPAESHPIAMQHILEGQARGGTIVSIDPRYTKTSAHADYFHRLRPGTDVALVFGLLNYVREQDGLDDTFLGDRVMGWPDVEAELDQYDLETVADITWIDQEDLEEIGDLIVENSPHIQVEWAMGGTQHNNGTQNIRSYALFSLATGSAARSGGGLQVMRGHANVQGATDLGVDASILPGYYGVDAPGSWEHWSSVWDQSPWTSGSISFEDLYRNFERMPNEMWAGLEVPASVEEGESDSEDEGESPNGGEQGGGDGDSEGSEDEGLQEDAPLEEPDPQSMMFQRGLTVARWYEAALGQEDRLLDSNLYQPNPLKMAFFWGHSANSISEMDKMKRAMEALDLLVVVDVFPAISSTLPDDADVLLLPASSQYEHVRSVTNSHRSVQWSEAVATPAHNSKPDLQIMQELADYMGFGEHFDWGSGPEQHNGRSSYEEALREINLGVRSIGYQQPPEKLQQHHEYDWAFSTEDLRAENTGTPVDGDYWSLPWPYWGGDHPGSPIIWTKEADPRDGGHDFRVNWGQQAPTPQEWTEMDVDKEYPLQETVDQQGEDGLDLIAESFEAPWWDGQEIQGVPSYPGYATILPDDPTEASSQTLPVQAALDEDVSVYEAAQAVNEQYGDQVDVDPAEFEEYDAAQPDPPTGRGKARAVVWNFIDTVPVHREPVESPRPDLVEEWPANGEQTNFWRLDQNNASVQEQATAAVHTELGSDFESGRTVIMTSGRQVEHQGGGAETRNNKYTADRQPHMYAEISPSLAEELDVVGGDDHVVVTSADKGSILVKANVTNRVNDEEVFLPYHWGGVFHGEDRTPNWPDGTEPLAIGESANIITPSGFDAETQMQETKSGVVHVQKATQSVVDDLDMEFIDYPQDSNGLGRQKQYDVREWDMENGGEQL
ncbi:molybdopterin oxidoreductase [Haloterrigena turkmenica DSM 5511]|uniref:Molybdopterin oxidoreductase n=1 Tax=Haloterrigena turkmenica (strain ATCC 51198 / DSM 5511 / JCM 9101 / NCIMB 13204 / VKM B-1734 / 4k) TaxID=543526 RepID=D2RUQ8_HALTV|nr:molybdopterin-dependent oxidoreductase [Haloterrigena turkmenica]ADB61230.1 molybdopterin oxidoreductase [Haloterrigena turkmenica DSM 5511]